MKKFLKVLGIVTIVAAMFIMTGCEKESPFWEPIKKDIINDAMGVDFDFKLIELEVRDTVFVSESIDDWFLLNNDSGESREDCVNGVEAFVNEMKDIYKQTGEPEEVDYTVWKYKLDRIKYLQSKQPSEIDYYVVFVNYQFENIMLDNRITTIYRYYLVSPQMEVTNDMEEEDFKEIEKEYNSTPLLKYEFWMLQDLLEL
jgi:hypothetical protein